MKNRSVISIVSLLALVVVGLIYLAVHYFDRKNHYNWYVDYKNTTEQPYGSGIARLLLQDYFPNHEMTFMKKNVFDFLEDKTKEQGSNYFFLGEHLYLRPRDMVQLHRFVSNGNNAMICANNFPQAIADSLFSDCRSYWEFAVQIEDTVVSSNFKHPALRSDSDYRFHFQFEQHLSDFPWYYFRNYDCLSPSDFRALGHMNGDPQKVDFLALKVGKGNLYLHTNPVLFTNYYLIQEEGAEYFSKVISHLSEGNIYYDDYNELPPQDQAKGSGGGFSQGAFYYILSQPALRWAAYIALIACLLYVFFRAKRSQKAIDVIEPNINTSLSFTKTIGSLYFMQHNYVQLVEQMHRMFLQYIKNRYYLSVNKVDADFMKQLASKSQLPLESIQHIFETYRNIKGYSQIESVKMVRYHQALEYFYKNSK